MRSSFHEIADRPLRYGKAPYCITMRLARERELLCSSATPKREYAHVRAYSLLMRPLGSTTNRPAPTPGVARRRAALVRASAIAERIVRDWRCGWADLWAQ